MSRKHAFFLILPAALLLWNLNYAPLWNPDEGRYAAASLEMAQPFDGSAPDWVVPHLNTLPRLNKPPLVYWCTATFFKLFGANETSARLVSALAAVGVLILLWQLGRAMFDEDTGIAAALIWATSTLPFALARVLNTDMLLTFSMTLALLGLWKMSRERNLRPFSISALMAGIGLGLAMLSKGPVGVALPLLIWASWLLLAQGNTAWRAVPAGGILVSLVAAAWRALPKRGLFVSVLIAVLIATPWYLAIAREHPEFLKGFLLGENLARLTGAKFYHNPSPFWFYLPVALLGLFPWTFFLLSALAQAREDLRALWRKDAATTPQNDSTLDTARHRLFLWLWIFAIIVLFSISRVKLITYILPAFPALVLLLAACLRRSLSTRVLPRTLKVALWGTIIIYFLFALVLPIVFGVERILADKILPRAEMAPYLIAICAILLTGALALLFALRRVSTLNAPQGERRLLLTQFAIGAMLFIALAHFAGNYARYEDPSPMLLALRPHLQKGDTVVEFKTFQPTAIFYFQRPTMIVDFVNTSGLHDEQFRASPLFPKKHMALSRLVSEANQSNRAVYVLAKWKHVHWPTLPKLFVIARNNDYRLLSNRPAPRGFSYDFIAPRKINRPLSPECQALDPKC